MASTRPDDKLIGIRHTYIVLKYYIYIYIQMLAYFFLHITHGLQVSMHSITSKYRTAAAAGLSPPQLQPRNAIPSMDRTPRRAFIDPHDLTDANPMRIFSTATAPTRLFFQNTCLSRHSRQTVGSVNWIKLYFVIYTNHLYIGKLQVNQVNVYIIQKLATRVQTKILYGLLCTYVKQANQTINVLHI